MLKKMISVLLAGLTVAALALPALAAPAENNTVLPAYDLATLSGAPIDKDGKQYDTDATVTPGQTIYFLLPGDAGKMLGDDRYVRMSSRKTRSSKYIGNIYLTQKYLTTKQVPEASVPTNLKNQYYYATNSVPVNRRNTYVAVELKDYTGSEEVRIDFDVTFTVRRDSTNGYGFRYGTGSTLRNQKIPPVGTVLDDEIYNPWCVQDQNFRQTGDRITFSSRLYVANKAASGSDTVVMAGGSGKTIKVAASADNYVSFETEYDTIATLEFTGATNPDNFIAKLSTKWPSDLGAKFADTDAVIWKFSPANIDCVSRAKLTLSNPFYEDLNPARAYVYTVDSRGVLKDVTRSFYYDKNEDAFYTYTRSLGTYIISDRKVRTTSR